MLARQLLTVNEEAACRKIETSTNDHPLHLEVQGNNTSPISAPGLRQIAPAGHVAGRFVARLCKPIFCFAGSRNCQLVWAIPGVDAVHHRHQRPEQKSAGKALQIDMHRKLFWTCLGKPNAVKPGLAEIALAD